MEKDIPDAILGMAAMAEHKLPETFRQTTSPQGKCSRCLFTTIKGGLLEDIHLPLSYE